MVHWVSGPFSTDKVLGYAEYCVVEKIQSDSGEGVWWSVCPSIKYNKKILLYSIMKVVLMEIRAF